MAPPSYISVCMLSAALFSAVAHAEVSPPRGLVYSATDADGRPNSIQGGNPALISNSMMNASQELLQVDAGAANPATNVSGNITVCAAGSATEDQARRHGSGESYHRRICRPAYCGSNSCQMRLIRKLLQAVPIHAGNSAAGVNKTALVMTGTATADNTTKSQAKMRPDSYRKSVNRLKFCGSIRCFRSSLRRRIGGN